MTTNLNHLIEKFILGKLRGKELLDFQQNMELSPEIASEVQFNIELSESIKERDVMDLRSSIQSIFNPVEKNNKEKSNLFDLVQNLDQTKISNSKIDSHYEIENSLQFIHLDNHKKSQSERIHEVKSESINTNYANSFVLTDEGLWSEVSKSLQETDIIELRNNLSQLIADGNTTISDFEIDQFIDEELSLDSMADIELMIHENHQFANQVKLHKEIDKAIHENDVYSLRTAINNIVEEEQMVSYSEIKRIDDYLMSYLSNRELNEFEEQLSENLRLKAETNLNFEINQSILENDVMSLRTALSTITSNNSDETKTRQFIPNLFRKSPSRFIGAAASIAAIVSVGAITLSQQKLTAEEIYSNAYKPYDATGLYRSASSVLPELIGVDLYNVQKYHEAIDQFNILLKTNPDHPLCNFYSGLSYQQLNEFKYAIVSYQKVIDEKDNLFIEQAEWYMALCFLKTNEQKKAYATFNRIIEMNGYYSKDVKEIMEKIE